MIPQKRRCGPCLVDKQCLGNNITYFSFLIPLQQRIIYEFVLGCANGESCFVAVEQRCKCLVWASIPCDTVLASYCLFEVLIDTSNGGSFRGCQNVIDHLFRSFTFSNRFVLHRIPYAIKKSSEKKARLNFISTLKNVFKSNSFCDLLGQNRENYDMLIGSERKEFRRTCQRKDDIGYEKVQHILNYKDAGDRCPHKDSMKDSNLKGTLKGLRATKSSSTKLTSRKGLSVKKKDISKDVKVTGGSCRSKDITRVKNGMYHTELKDIEIINFLLLKERCKSKVKEVTEDIHCEKEGVGIINFLLSKGRCTSKVKKVEEKITFKKASESKDNKIMDFLLTHERCSKSVKVDEEDISSSKQLSTIYRQGAEDVTSDMLIERTQTEVKKISLDEGVRQFIEDVPPRRELPSICIVVLEEMADDFLVEKTQTELYRITNEAGVGEIKKDVPSHRELPSICILVLEDVADDFLIEKTETELHHISKDVGVKEIKEVAPPHRELPSICILVLEDVADDFLVEKTETELHHISKDVGVREIKKVAPPHRELPSICILVLDDVADDFLMEKTETELHHISNEAGVSEIIEHLPHRRELPSICILELVNVTDDLLSENTQTELHQLSKEAGVSEVKQDIPPPRGLPPIYVKVLEDITDDFLVEETETELQNVSKESGVCQEITPYEDNTITRVTSIFLEPNEDIVSVISKDITEMPHIALDKADQDPLKKEVQTTEEIRSLVEPRTSSITLDCTSTGDTERMISPQLITSMEELEMRDQAWTPIPMSDQDHSVSVINKSNNCIDPDLSFLLLDWEKRLCSTIRECLLQNIF